MGFGTGEAAINHSYHELVLIVQQYISFWITSLYRAGRNSCCSIGDEELVTPWSVVTELRMSECYNVCSCAAGTSSSPVMSMWMPCQFAPLLRKR